MATSNSFFKPVLSVYRPLVSEVGWAAMRRSVWISVLNGALEGLALLLLLPAASSLASGHAVWGLPFLWWLAILIVIAVASFVIEYILGMQTYVGAMDFINVVHKKIGDMIAKIPLGWFKPKMIGRFSRMVSSEMMLLGETIAHMYYPLMRSIAALLVVTVGSWAWDWRLGLVLTVSVPVLYLLMVASRFMLYRGKKIVEPANQELASRVVEYAMCQGALRSCGRSQDFPQLTQAIDDTYRAGKKDLWWSIFGNALTGAFSQVIVVTMIVVAAALVTGGSMGPIETIAFMGMSLRFMEMLTSISGGVMGIEDRRILLDQMEEISSTPLLPEVATSAPMPTPGSVDIQHVTFGYEADTPVLHDVSFHVAPGTMTALVGPSGCGKTTLARLISRFYDTDSGAIKVGGADVRDITTKDLMAQLSMVFQDVYLFDDTLEENIRIGREDATDEEVRHAAALAGVDEIVARLPHGYQTQVGEGGRALSGGERQRVSVARALLKQAPIVLFDEATSALDAENEANIVASMNELRGQATMIVIAHKLETILQADQVVVFSADGHVVQVGTHNDLVAVDGPYQGFWQQREKAQGWKLV